MLKNISQLSHKIADRSFHLLCDNDSPLNEVKEALFEFLKFIGKIEDAAKASQQDSAEEKPAEEKVEEPQE